MRHFFIFLFSVGIILYFLSNCASIKPPGGGPRDTIPPSLINSIPPNKSINYTGNSVKLYYDELLKLENLNKQLIITPIISEEYEYTLKKNSIEIKFENSFKDSTTFTFNFQNALQDITEGNVTLDNVLAFSTTDYIDSMSVFGTVNDLFTNKPLESITVCLYEYGDTLDIFNSPPMYLARTNKQGIYSIENIKTGNYKIYAYDDQNSNLKCDVPREMFGFKADTLFLYTPIDSIHLKVLYNDIRDLKITRAGTAGKYFEIKINKNLTDYTVSPINKDFAISNNFGTDHKTIRFYDTIHSNDSIEFVFTAYDSVGYSLVDTLFLKFTESKRKEETFDYLIQPKSGSKITDQFQAQLKFSKPIAQINRDSIFFKYDSVTFQYIPDSISFNINEKKDEIRFDIKLQMLSYIEKIKALDTVQVTDKTDFVKGSGIKKTSIKFELDFHIGKGAFISIEQDTLINIDYIYTPIDESKFGTILGNVISDYDAFHIQLMDKQMKVQAEIQNEKQFKFKNISPGEYTFRVLVDENNNGKWDPGNIIQNIEPEKIYFHSEKMLIKEFWEMTDINLEF